MPSKAKSVSFSKNFSPCIGLTGRPAAAAALQEIQGLGGSFFLNLLFMWNMSPARMMWRLRILTEEECIIGQAGLVAVRESMPLRPGRAGSSPVVRLVLLALKTKAGLRLRRTSLATVLAPPRSAKRGKGMGVTGGAGGGAQQKSGRIKTTLKSLLLRAILLNAMAACSCWGWGRLKIFQTTLRGR